ncbi:MAG: SGNH/GDSL hydrolase family protein [Planctomycetota bacterium]|jgi:hypothetical protein
MAPAALLKKHIILYSVVIIFSCGLLLEIAARIITRGPRWINPYYIEISKDFDRLDQLLDDIQKAQQHGLPKYYQEFLYASAPFQSAHLNYTDYYSSRLVPDSVSLTEAENIIWTFGGSTMQNTETTDDLTIANNLAKMFNRTLGPTHVKNFGVGGFFSSYELIKFQKLLRGVPESELPSMVIFYDGYNDSVFSFLYGAGNMVRHLSLKLEALVEHKDLSLSTYSFSRMISRHSRFWERTGHRFIEYALFPPVAFQRDDENLDAAVRVYTSNMKMIVAICDAFDIVCFFVLQPLIATKSPLTDLEKQVLENLKIGPEGVRYVRKFYDRVRKKMADNEHFIDGSNLLNGRVRSDYYDIGHTSAETSPVIGQKIAHMILARVRTKDPQAFSPSAQESSGGTAQDQ